MTGDSSESDADEARLSPGTRFGLVGAYGGWLYASVRLLDVGLVPLVVIGALGIGRARDSVIGSVCERVARQSDRDVWVVKHVPEAGEADRVLLFAIEVAALHELPLLGIRGLPGAGAYSASKAAVRFYGEALRGAMILG